ncbi:tetratricopeptide repeat protein [Paeniglutamicibacter antarcticus]|uniref:Tetratricopeptide repeat protein n=1 Tax=Arthrobacter terrae TaxID=2935737 RepID=A0A931CT50_9MICC|nr:tetratricopeptide repeat protein [Arthrobacter terrae]MBG0741756.1 tetratricopeptide repeat protein [Arthrobacter terrae]
MSQPASVPVNPAFAAGVNLRGAVDLSALKKPRPAGPAGASPGGGGAPANGQPADGADGAAGAAAGYAVDVTEQSFQELVQVSSQVPVVVSLGAAWSGQSSSLNVMLERLVSGYAGRLLLARVDAEASPQIAQAFAAQAIPTVVALINGQPVPLFEGEMPEEQVGRLLDELLKVAAANGVNGNLGADPADADAEPTPPPLPPLHQEAFDAIEAGDYDAAETAYRRALADQPADADAKIGLAQVHLMQRTTAIDTQQADALRHTAAQNTDDVDAQLTVADLDVIGGHVEDGFGRILAFISAHFGPERETARIRLLELFDVVGVTDPRVSKARQALARALF